MSPIVAAFLRSTVLPAVLAGAALYLLGGKSEPLRARLQALVVALAFTVGAYLLLGHFAFPPVDVSESLSYVALGLAVFVWIAPKDLKTRYALRAVFVLALGALLLWHIRESLMGNPVHLRNLVAFFCLSLAMWSITERASRQVALPTLLLLPLITASGLSFLMLFAASAAFSQLVTVLCGQIGVALALSVVARTRVSEFALLPFNSVFLALFMVAGHFYLDVNPWSLIFLCWPFLVLWVRAWVPVPKTWWIEAPVLGAISAAPVGYQLWTAFQAAGPFY